MNAPRSTSAGLSAQTPRGQAVQAVILFCTFRQNVAQGGALCLSNTCVCARCMPVFPGGALYIRNSGSGVLPAVVRGTVFEDNHAQGGGGAMSVYYKSQVVLTKCTMSRNTGQVGGAIQFGGNWGGNDVAVRLTSCVLKENAAVGGGDGVHMPAVQLMWPHLPSGSCSLVIPV